MSIAGAEPACGALVAASRLLRLAVPRLAAGFDLAISCAPVAEGSPTIAPPVTAGNELSLSKPLPKPKRKPMEMPPAPALPHPLVAPALPIAAAADRILALLRTRPGVVWAGRVDD